MSHSSADDPLERNPVSPLSSPISGESEEEEEDDELQNSFESSENGLYGQVEEAREGKTRTLPKGPTAWQIRAHRLTHYPSRSWCPQCVAGRAKGWPYFRQDVDCTNNMVRLLLLERSSWCINRASDGRS